MLLERLQCLGMRVDHSPLNPAFGDDVRWQSWYTEGLQSAIASTSVFVSVIDVGWDSSTWMAIELAQALSSESTRDSVRFWNPDRIVVKAQGVLQYLTLELPYDLTDAATEITRLAQAERGLHPTAGNVLL